MLIATPINARSLEDIRASEELRICVAPIHPSAVSIEPQGCSNDCIFSGPAVEAATAFAKTFGKVTPVLKQVTWDEQFQDASGVTAVDATYTPALFADGTCDLMPSHLTITDWRLTKMNIVPLFENRMIVMLNSDNADKIKDLSDLAGKTTAAGMSTSFHVWLERQNNETFADNPIQILDGDLLDAFAELDSGQIDFVLADVNAALWLIRNRMPNAEVGFAIGEGQQIGWGVRLEDHELAASLEAFFRDQKSSQTSELNRIWEAHFGVTLSRFETLVRSLN